MVMLSLVILAISVSSNNMYLLVYFSIAGTSDAKKLPDLLLAIIKGDEFLRAYKALESSRQIIPKAKDPFKILDTLLIVFIISCSSL